MEESFVDLKLLGKRIDRDKDYASGPVMDLLLVVVVWFP